MEVLLGLGGVDMLYFLPSFFFERFGVLCAGVFGTGVFKRTSLRKRMKFSLLKLRRRRAVVRGAFIGGVRRTGRGGVSNAASMFMFRFGVGVRRGRRGAFGVFLGMG